MTDLSYNYAASDAAFLQTIGGFIKTRRMAQNLSQEEVAEKAVISRSTLSLVERGENVSLLNLLKILRVLDALYVLDAFKVVPSLSPLQLAKADAKARKRASRKQQNTDSNNDVTW